jgi:hypothetical protein
MRITPGYSGAIPERQMEMRLANISLAALLILSAGLSAVGQQVDRPDAPPPKYADSPARMDKPDRPGRDYRPPMDIDQLREAIKVLRQIDPEKALKLEQHLDKNPERVGRALHENFPHLRRFLEMRRYDPDGFELRIKDLALSRQSQQSVRRLHEAEKSGDDALAAAELAALEGIVADHFDIRQQIREHELAKLERQIQVLREQLTQRAEDRDALIVQRIEEFVAREKTDRW